MDAARARYYGTLGTFWYSWLHIPSGAKGERTIENTDRAGALEQLNRWNAAGNGAYTYYLLP